MRSKKAKSRKKNELPKVTLKEKVAEMLELPKEIVLDMPKMTLLGSRSLIIENYKSIIEYDEKKIRIKTGIGVIKICGFALSIKEITSEDIMVDGRIESMEFIK